MTIDASYIPLFYICFILIIVTGMGVIGFRMVSKLGKMTQFNSSSAAENLLPWQSAAFADLTWDRSYHRTATPTLRREQRVIKSFSRLSETSPPEPTFNWAALEAILQNSSQEAGWLSCELQMKQFIVPLGNIMIVRTSNRTVELEIEQTIFGSMKAIQVRLDGQPRGRFSMEGRAMTLFDSDNLPIGAWHVGDKALSIGDPDGPHHYGPIEIQGQPVAEMLVPGLFSVARFIHQPAPPLLHNLTPTLTSTQEASLLLFVALQLYLLSVNYNFSL
jgi:hypothetical protein